MASVIEAVSVTATLTQAFTSSVDAVRLQNLRVMAAHSVDGTASWFAAPDGQAAAGLGLRQALGAGWRGTRVTVCAGRRCVVVTLTDWCQCGNGRIIDLDRGQFARLTSLSKGLVPVRVTW